MLRSVAASSGSSFTSSAVSWRARAATLLLWLLAAASVGYWALRLLAPADRADGTALAGVSAPSVDASQVARALGAVVAVNVAAPQGQAGNRFVLTGVVADQRRGGAALIAVDGKPGKTYRVGAQLEPGLWLQAVGPRRAMLAPSMDAPPSVTLELPPLKN